MPNRDLLAAIDAALPCRSLHPFAPLLEERYQQRSRQIRHEDLGRTLLAAAIGNTMCFAFDLLCDIRPLAAAASLRLAFDIQLLLAGWTLRRNPPDWMVTILVSVPTVGAMAITTILSKLASESVAERYMDAAPLAMFAIMATCPGRPTDCLLGGLAGLVLSTALFALIPGPIALHENWSYPLLGALVLAASYALVRRAEIVRRTEFLQNLRHELQAAELNLRNAELLNLSSTDTLTGLPNRRQIEKNIWRFWTEPLAPGLGVALIDVDFFKTFNDAAGHVAGDSCLRVVASALLGALHDPLATVGRFGGEEFLVVAPGLDRAALTRLGERLRWAVEDANLPHPAFPGQTVTVSIGLSWRDASVRTGRPEDLIREADQALYAAKEAGRNRLMSAAPSAGLASAHP